MSEENMMKLWKGIFYYFWNCDKPLFQEERADILSKYIHVFQSEDCAFLYLDTFLQTMAREWFTIDRYRLEKFMMLVRKFLSESFVFLKNKKWDVELIKQFKKVMKKTVINTAPESAPLGLKIHVAEIYTEELAKVGADELSPETVKTFLVPFCNILCNSEEPSLVKTIAKEVFIYFINQDAETDEFEEFPILKFDVDVIQNLLMKYANKPDLKRKNMKVIYDVVKQFEDYKNGISQEDRLFADQGPARKLRKRAIEKAALALVEEEMAEKAEKSVKKRKKIQNVIDL
nr:ribosomal RNA processing protein 1 homolog B isoform X2 [Parasteatoda tepidariorum]